ncbi:hypothetical protein KCP74_01195 [Salmonella enterica subsp. enterica]|nr:hypothetical protein KCP74_01195 [Salmonella enterica subsp. enterica]
MVTVIHFGATTVDEFEHAIAPRRGSGDLVDPDEGQQALKMTGITEINKETKRSYSVVTSGYFRTKKRRMARVSL